MFDVKKDKRATKNANNACRGRWSVCNGANVNVDNIRWHICNACSIKRVVSMARGDIRPNVAAVARKATTTRKATRKASPTIATVANV